jgi:hypothetical protein
MRVRMRAVAAQESISEAQTVSTAAQPVTVPTVVVP